MKVHHEKTLSITCEVMGMALSACDRRDHGHVQSCRCIASR